MSFETALRRGFGGEAGDTAAQEFRKFERSLDERHFELRLEIRNIGAKVNVLMGVLLVVAGSLAWLAFEAGGVKARVDNLDVAVREIRGRLDSMEQTLGVIDRRTQSMEKRLAATPADVAQ